MKSSKDPFAIVSRPFIYLKTCHPEAPQQVKVRYPANYNILEELATKKLVLKRKISGLYDENGKRIVSIDDISPGSLVIVSTYPPKVNENNIDPKTKLFGPLTSISNPLDIEEEHLSYDYSQDDENVDYVIIKKKKPSLKPPERSFISESDIKMIPNGSRIPIRRKEKKEIITLPVEEFVDDKALESIEESIIEVEGNTEFSYNQPEEIKHIVKLTDVVEFPSSVFNDIKGAMEQRKSKSLNKFSNLNELENSQIQRWVRSINKLFELEGMRIENVEFQKEMGMYVSDFIEKHRVVCGNRFSYVFSSIVVGPQKSGKSTFMGVLGNQLSLDIASTESWKQYFIFPYNIQRAVSSENHVELFKYMVSHIFRCIAEQNPIFRKWIPSLQQSFFKIVESNGLSTLPLPFIKNCPYRETVTDLLMIFENLKSLYRDLGFEDWIRAIFKLPLSLSRAFGWTNSILVLDHFEKSNFKFMASHPFNNDYFVVFSSVVLELLELTNYIISCSSEIFQNKTIPISFIKKSRILPIYEIVEIDNEYDVSIIFENSKIERIVLNSKICEGIPYYVHQWNSIMALFDELDESPRELIEEIKTEIDISLESFIRGVYGMKDDDEMSFAIKKASRKLRK